MKHGGHGHSQSGSRGNKKIGAHGHASSWGDASNQKSKTKGGKSGKQTPEYPTR